MSITFEKLFQSLKDKKFQPVYLLHGPEPYFIDLISDYISEKVLTPSEQSFNQQVFYGKDVDATVLYNACTRYPLMSDKQVIIVKEAQNMKTLQAMESYFEKPVPTTILVICHKYKTLDKRLKVAKVLEKNALVFESKKLQDNKIPEWISKAVVERGLNISEKATYRLADFIGNDLETLNNAIEKLSINASPDRPIDEKDVEQNVGFSREYNIFELTNALASGDMVRITKMVNYICSNPKENPFPVVVQVLYGFFSKLTAIYLSSKRDKDTLKSFGIMDWVQKDFLRAAQIYGPNLKNIIDLLQVYDLRFKGVNDTGTPESQLFKELLYRITLSAT